MSATTTVHGLTTKAILSTFTQTLAVIDSYLLTLRARNQWVSIVNRS